jgi:hypothetical protein
MALPLACTPRTAPTRIPPPESPTPISKAPEAPQLPVGPDSARAPSVALRYALGSAAYRITTIGTISPAGDSTTKMDTVSTSTLIRYTTAWDSVARMVRATGIVRMRVSGAPAPHTTISSATESAVPFTATIDTASGLVTLSTDSGGRTTCPAPSAAALDQVREYLSSLQRPTARATEWQDTTVSTTCRGEIPVTATIVRTFTASRPGTTGPAVVSHTSRAVLLGTAVHRGQSVSLTGTGDGVTDAEYDAESGRLVREHGIVDLDINVISHVGGSALMRQFHQHADMSIVASSPGAP